MKIFVCWWKIYSGNETDQMELLSPLNILIKFSEYISEEYNYYRCILIIESFQTRKWITFAWMMMGGFDNWSEIKPSSYLWGQKDEEVRSIGLVPFLFVDKWWLQFFKTIIRETCKHIHIALSNIIFVVSFSVFNRGGNVRLSFFFKCIYW